MPIPCKVRASPKVKDVEDIPGGAQCVFEVTFEREGTEKPVCVAETVVRVYAGGDASRAHGGARRALTRRRGRSRAACATQR